MFKLKILLLELSKKMWPKVTFFALLAVATAFLAVYLGHYIPDYVTYKVGAETVTSILNILASSMLAVTTFSLTAMVTALNAATSNVSSRAAQLIIQDRTAQNALATFLGIFLFSLAGIIGLNAGIYRGGGRLILFGMTLVIIILMLIVLIRWIERLTELGKLSETTELVEEAAQKALMERAKNPYLGANCYSTDIHLNKSQYHPLYSETCGYIKYIDVFKLSDIADEINSHLYLETLPGTFLMPNDVILYADKPIDDTVKEKLEGCYIIEKERTFEQDPQFGICVLSEIGQRAILSDTGTTIDAIGRLVRILGLYETTRDTCDVTYKRVWAPPLNISELFDDAFSSISREGAGVYEIQVKLQKGLRYLASLNNTCFRENAMRISRQSLKRALSSNLLEEEKAQLAELSLFSTQDKPHQCI